MGLSVLTLWTMNVVNAEQNPVTFTFKEYQYKDSPKNVSKVMFSAYNINRYLGRHILFK